MERLEEKLGYTFRSRALLEQALNHSSYANEHRGQGEESNERLEFLGDSILGFVSADHLFQTFGALPEGDLTRMRAALVCEQSLYEVARMLELDLFAADLYESVITEKYKLPFINEYQQQIVRC